MTMNRQQSRDWMIRFKDVSLDSVLHSSPSALPWIFLHLLTPKMSRISESNAGCWQLTTRNMSNAAKCWSSRASPKSAKRWWVPTGTRRVHCSSTSICCHGPHKDIVDPKDAATYRYTPKFLWHQICHVIAQGDFSLKSDTSRVWNSQSSTSSKNYGCTNFDV